MRLGIDGVVVGHWTDEEARTGCTVVRFPPETVASGEVRGGAPATRDFALLDPVRSMLYLDAVSLAGGSAYGLAAADGVMRWCEEHERGFMTGAGVVPIVVAMGIFDLMEGDATVRPGATEGWAAADAAAEDFAVGRVGAGTGATLSKWRGREHARPGGLGAAVCTSGDLRVGAIMVVNACGDLDDGEVLSQARAGQLEVPSVEAFGNTTVGVVVTNAELTKIGCNDIARVGHGAFARALVPAHTPSDGDALVVAATGTVEAELNLVRVLAVAAVEDAIRAGVRSADIDDGGM